MNSRTTDTRPAVAIGRQFLLIAVITLFLLAGCAKKPWREALPKDGRQEVFQLLEEMRALESQRPACLDTDVVIHFTSHLKNRSVSGYLLFAHPDSIKFITSNPFGQPVFAVVSRNGMVNYINTLEHLFVRGSLSEFAQLYEIPAVSTSTPWGSWLTARFTPDAGAPFDVRSDAENNGVWVSFYNQGQDGRGNSEAAREHLLLDPKSKRILSRLLTDMDGAVLVRIDYSDWLKTMENQPGTITVSELDYGGKAVIEFSALQEVTGCSSRDFMLNQPVGYRYYPLAEDAH